MLCAVDMLSAAVTYTCQNEWKNYGDSEKNRELWFQQWITGIYTLVILIPSKLMNKTPPDLGHYSFSSYALLLLSGLFLWHIAWNMIEAPYVELFIANTMLLVLS